MKFGQNLISVLGGNIVSRNCFQTDGCTHRCMNARQTKCDHKSSPCHYMTGELKIKTMTTLGEGGGLGVGGGGGEEDMVLNIILDEHLP